MKTLTPKVIYLETTTSTNDVIAQMARDGAADFTVVQADEQTAGRGRRGRTWSTLAGESVACSALFRDTQATHLPLLTALATCQALKTWLPEVRIKWPNDVLVNGKKISGILVEHNAHEGLAFYTVGTGINVGAGTVHFWQDYPEATSLLHERPELNVSVQDVLSLYLNYLGQMVSRYRTEGWDAFFTDLYRQNCATLGQQVRWRVDVNGTEANDIVGTALDLDADGALILQTAAGKTHKVLSGDIIKDAAPCQK